MTHLNWTGSLQKWSEESLLSTIVELEARGESLELVRLRVEARNRLRARLFHAGVKTKYCQQAFGKLLDDFWAKVDIAKEDECWHWSACRDACGYGVFAWPRSITKLHPQGKGQAHVFAVMASGRCIPKGMQIRHICDVKSCCNQAHLLVGTHMENVQDATDRNRWRNAKGSLHHKAKITEEQALIIRASDRNSESEKILAARFGLSVSTIRRIQYDIGWRHLPRREEIVA